MREILEFLKRLEKYPGGKWRLIVIKLDKRMINVDMFMKICDIAKL